MINVPSARTNCQSTPPGTTFPCSNGPVTWPPPAVMAYYSSHARVWRFLEDINKRAACQMTPARETATMRDFRPLLLESS